MKRLQHIRMALALACGVLGLSPSAPSFADTKADTGTAAAQVIVARCSTDVASCMAAFDHFARSDVESNISGGFTLPFFKASDETFFGYAQELYYTELTVGQVEYQVGFGYIVAAHQQDAKPSASGAFSGVQGSADADLGNTSFSTSLIGLAPATATDCTTVTPQSAVELRLLCAININPNVTQDYFRARVTDLSTAMNAWKAAPPAFAAGKWTLCPQVIDFRYSDPAMRAKTPPIADVQSTVQEIQTAMSANCAASTPNAHVFYKNGPPKGPSSGDLNIAGGTANASHTVISQGYFRNRNYLANTKSGWEALYDDAVDHYSEVYVDGLTAAASLPSVLAAIVTLNTTVQDQHMYVHTYCSGGARTISVSAFSTAGADPVAEANAYGTLFNSLRTGADTPGAKC